MTEARETAERIVRDYYSECGPGPYTELLPGMIAAQIEIERASASATARRAAIEECAELFDMRAEMLQKRRKRIATAEWTREDSDYIQATSDAAWLRSLLTPAAAPEGGTT